MTVPAAARSDIDTVDLLERLIACRSVTPDDGGSLDLLASILERAGFACERLDRGNVRNLWAQHGTADPIVCLAGHVDVVPPGPLDRWTSDPFQPVERNGYLYGRGAADMKASVAAMTAAAVRVATGPPHAGTIAVLLTSDEEGDAVDGTNAVVDVLRSRGIRLDCCILGEPTSTSDLGDTIKNGRRGSLHGVVTFRGVQCHIAFPEQGVNPIHGGLPALVELSNTTWDTGTGHFGPTSFQISNVRAGAGAVNVVPGTLEAAFNFRFSPASTVDDLKSRVQTVLDRNRLPYDLTWTLASMPFICPPGRLVDEMGAAIERVTGRRPALSTSGGTSDGRFLSAISQELVEFGPVNRSIHAVDEHVRVADLAPLAAIYERTLAALLARGPN
jgi:succinyl-diaminopimelate desuccinylase